MMTDTSGVQTFVRVEPPAEADLDHRDVAPPAAEVQEAEGGADLEERVGGSPAASSSPHGRRRPRSIRAASSSCEIGTPSTWMRSLDVGRGAAT